MHSEKSIQPVGLTQGTSQQLAGSILDSTMNEPVAQRPGFPLPVNSAQLNSQSSFINQSFSRQPVSIQHDSPREIRSAHLPTVKPLRRSERKTANIQLVQTIKSEPPQLN